MKKVAESFGFKNLKIGVVLGDDILNRIDELIQLGIDLKNMETGESIITIKDRLLSANVYFGSQPIVEALKQGAQLSSLEELLIQD